MAFGLHTEVLSGLAQADGTQTVSLVGHERFFQIQVQLDVSATPSAGVLTVSGQAPGATGFVTLGTIDMTDSTDYLKVYSPYYLQNIRFSPASFDAGKTYSIALVSGT